jgi:hypothetical protein
MKNFYFTKSHDFSSYPSTDVAQWSAIYKLVKVPIGLVDRTNHVVMPYRYKVYEPFKIPTDLTGFDLSYEDCCLKRAVELVELSKKLNIPITLFYSGGIDSTAVLISFMKVLDAHELKNRVRVAMSTDSINENINFFYDHIRTKFTIISSERYSSMMDGTSLIVGGECNDQLFGSDILAKVYKYADSDKLHDKYSREFIVDWLSKSMEIGHANKWFDVLDDQIRHAAPCEVHSNFHFFWWYNFCFKWQFVYFRMLAFMDPNARQLVNQTFMDTYYHHFFASTDFQKWSMLNHDKKLLKDWKSYKLESKKFIFDYNKDEIYYNEKIKMGSLFNLMIKKIVAKAITDDYTFLDKIDLNEFYVPNNSFV